VLIVYSHPVQVVVAHILQVGAGLDKLQLHII
jgi:hypothetical protein